jgi:hypothetical protein
LRDRRDNGLTLKASLGLAEKLNCELLGRTIRIFSQTADLGHPLVLGRGFFVENQHDIARHTLLRNQNLLVAIDNEVATLVIATLLGIFYDLRLGQVRQMTKL